VKPRTPADTPGGGGTAQRATPADAGLCVAAVARWGVGPVSFTAEPGEVVIITGRCRSGKSTVAGIVAGFTKPDAGRVLLDGVDVHSLTDPELEARIGWFTAVAGPAVGVEEQPALPLVVADEPQHAHPMRVVCAAVRAFTAAGSVVIIVAHPGPITTLGDQVVRL